MIPATGLIISPRTLGKRIFACSGIGLLSIRRTFLGVLVLLALALDPGLAQGGQHPVEIDKDGAVVLNYANIIGRARACGARTEPREKQVRAWIYRSFSGNDADIYRTMFDSMVDFQERRQINGQTGDSCVGIWEVFGATGWP